MTPDTLDAQPLLGPIRAVRIFCRDLDVARRFYREQLRLAELTANPDWLVYDTGGVQVIVEVAESGGSHTDEPDEFTTPDGEALVGRFCGFSFAVDDAARVCDELRVAGVEIAGPPELMPWGGTLAHIADPDGNVLTLVQYPRPD
jgi:lactoylglutathione lyase